MKKEQGSFIGAKKTTQKSILFATLKRNAYQNGPVFGTLGGGMQFRLHSVLIGQENIVVSNSEREYENMKDSLVNNSVMLIHSENGKENNMSSFVCPKCSAILTNENVVYQSGERRAEPMPKL